MRYLMPLLLALSGCVTTATPDPGRLLAIGDSVMAWNGAAGIPEVTAQALGQPVTDASVSGARIVQPNRRRAAFGLDIRAQWAANQGRWDWVLMDGGGNDMRRLCATPGEGAGLNALISDQLTGAIPELIAQIRATGTRVAFMGYYDGAEAEPTGFTPCQRAFDEMNRRMARLATNDPGLVFVDAGDVIDPTRTTLYERDLIHPAPEGSRLIGLALARAIEAAR